MTKLKSTLTALFMTSTILSANATAHAEPIKSAAIPRVVRECFTEFGSDGKQRNLQETKDCIKYWNATIVNPARGQWLWKDLPPEQYDVPYTGILMIQRLPIEQIHKVCISNQKMACAMVVSTYPEANAGKGGWQISMNGNRAVCLIIMPPDDYIWKRRQDPKDTIRHELGHCNGWPSDHPNSRSKWEWVEK
jgi:hypothetical protein